MNAQFFYPSEFLPAQAAVSLRPLDFSSRHDLAPAQAALAQSFPQITPLWLQQTHSAEVTDDAHWYPGIVADAVISRNPKAAALVRTADCVPILLASPQGKEVAAIHAGWRGLAQNIIAATLAQMHTPPTALRAWIGPCITQDYYEVDAAFNQKFTHYPQAFRPSRPGHYFADLVAIARAQLQSSGVAAAKISGGTLCTFSDRRFHSHRRDGADAGRLVSLIFPTA